MRRRLAQWQEQYRGLRGRDLGQAVLDAGRSGGRRGAPVRTAGGGGPGQDRLSGARPPPLPTVSALEKTLPQLLAKLSLLENRGAHNASLALSASIGRVRELIAQARGAAGKVSASAGGRQASGGPGSGH